MICFLVELFDARTIYHQRVFEDRTPCIYMTILALEYIYRKLQIFSPFFQSKRSSLKESKRLYSSVSMKRPALP